MKRITGRLTEDTDKYYAMINLSGRGDKDIDYIIAKYGIR